MNVCVFGKRESVPCREVLGVVVESFENLEGVQWPPFTSKSSHANSAFVFVYPLFELLIQV